MRLLRHHSHIALFAILLLALAACGEGSGAASGGTKAGGGAEPATLRLANAYGGLEFIPAVAHFIDQVDEQSAGNVRVEVIDDYAGNDPDAEQQVVRAVAAGEADLGWVGTRVFDTLGVSSFQALTAPMLIDSHPLQQAVIESEIPGQMLDGLDELEVTGLAVLAGGLHKPFATAGPLVAPEDWRGITFTSFLSNNHADAIAALGATPEDLWGTARDEGFVDGTIQGWATTLQIYAARPAERVTPYGTANVNLWPETAVLVANPSRLNELTEEQEGWLRDAAADAAARSTDLADIDAGLITDRCTNGARFAEATDADLAALRDAIAPVYEGLETDPETKRFIARINELKASVPAGEPLAIPPGCTGDAPPAASPTTGTDDPSVLNGVYRLEWTVEELMDQLEIPEGAASENAGVITLTFEDGTLVWEFKDPPAGPLTCVGTYSISDGRLSFVAGTGPEWECGGVPDRGQEHFTAAWELTDDALRLVDIRASEGYEPDQHYFEVFFGGKPWMKID